MKKINVFLLCVLAILSSCKKSEDSVTNKPNSVIVTPTGLTLQYNVHIIDTTKYKLNNDLKLLNQGIYQFTGNFDNINYNINDVILGYSNSGYLRKVTAVSKSGNTITLTTTQAAMTDAFKDGDISFDLNTDSLQSISSLGPMNRKLSLSSMRYSIPINNFMLYQKGPLSVSLQNGNLSINPSFHFDINFSKGVLNNFEVSCQNASLTGNFNLLFSASQPTSVFNTTDTLKKSKEIIRVWISGVPIPVEVDFNILSKFALSLNAAVNKQVNFSISNSINLGVFYNNSNWTNTHSFVSANSFTLTQSNGPTGVNVNFAIIPDISFKFYGVIGPKVSLAVKSNLIGNVASPALDWDFSVGAWLEPTFGIDVNNILSKQLPSYSKTFSSDTVKYTSPALINKISGDNQTGNINSSLPQPIKIQVLDSWGKKQSNVPVYFTVTAGGGSVSPASILTDSAGYAAAYWKLGSAQTIIQNVQVTSKKSNGSLIKNAPVEFAAVAKVGLKLGDSAYGGWIFYLDSTGNHGKVAKLMANQLLPWDPNKSSGGPNYHTPLIAIYRLNESGSDDTKAIIQKFGTGTYAASVCKNYNGGGYTNWYLATIDEITVMENYSPEFNISSGRYWSCSQVGIFNGVTITIGDNIYFYDPHGNPLTTAPNGSSIGSSNDFMGAFAVHAF